jgi:hypothetical protein
MARLLRLLVGGNPVASFLGDRGDQDVEQRIPVCFLALGHALESFEFNRMLERSPLRSRLYSVVVGSEKEPELRDGLPEIMRKMSRGRAIRIRDETSALNNLMRGLWHNIKNLADHPTRGLPVRGIERHELIAYLFRPTRFGLFPRMLSANPTEEQRIAIETYFEDRFLVEAALGIAKAKGFVDVRQIYGGRVGRYYQLLSGIKRGDRRRSIDHYLRALGMERRDVSTESYWHKTAATPGIGATAANDSKKGNPIHGLTIDPETFRARTCVELASTCTEMLSHNRLIKLNRDGNALLQKTLDSMFSGDEVEIAPARPASFIFRFESAMPVNTVAALKRQTELLLKGPWKLLLCVAESGEWLLDRDVAKISATKKASIGLIVADTVYEAKLQQVSGMHMRRLPWHLHNRHMTTRVKRNPNGEFVPDRAIYFERLYRSPQISPIILNARSDLDCVLDDFTVYWLKSERYQSGESETIELTQSELRRQRNRMLQI